MINVSDITKALKTQLENDSNLVSNSIKNIKRSEYVNYDPDLCPWVGIYKDSSDTEPASLGKNSTSWKSKINFSVLVQSSDLGSGEDCEDKLDKYIKLVKDAIWSDATIGGTVDMITGFTVEYSYELTDESTMHFQWATIKVIVEARTG